MIRNRQSDIDVLIVDDSAVVRRVMSALLGKHTGLRVHTASDPLVAMAKMRRHRPNVIVLDLEMPRMDGLTFLKQIMGSDPIPVVVCSGFAEPGTMLAVRALAAGAADTRGGGGGQRLARHRAGSRPGQEIGRAHV